MRYLGVRGGEKNGLIRSRLMLRRIFGAPGRTNPRRCRRFEGRGVGALSCLQSFGLALVIVGCQYARAIAIGLARMIALTITLRINDVDGLEHFVSVRD